MNGENYGVAPFDPAFDNSELTLAVAQAIEPLYAFEEVPAVMAMLVNGRDEPFFVQDHPRLQEHDSLEDTLLPHNHDPLECKAQAERGANHRADWQEMDARAASSDRRARANREAGIQEPIDSPWEDAAGIAEGEAIALARWGSHADLYANSSLADPHSVPAGPPRRECRFDTRRGVGRYNLPDRTEVEREAARVAAESRRRHALEIRADAAYKKLHDTQGEQKAIFKALLDLVNQWKVDDADTHAKWLKHFTDANMCSTSSVRIWSIVSWFQKGVPLSIRQAIDNLTFYYLQESWNAVKLQKLEAKLDLEITHYNGPGSEIVGTQQTDDDYWAVTAAAQENPGEPVRDSKTWLYGCFKFEPESHLKNGFLDHVSKGNGKTYAKHMLAHLAVREVWLEHMGDMTALDEEACIHLLVQWGPRNPTIRIDELSQAQKEEFTSAARAVKSFKTALLQSLAAIEAVAMKKQERVHGRSEDGDQDGAQPPKRIRTGDNASDL